MHCSHISFYTHVNYENLDSALENRETVNLEDAVMMMRELLEAFEPGHAFEEYDCDRMKIRKYERKPRKQAAMTAERNSILEALTACKVNLME